MTKIFLLFVMVCGDGGTNCRTHNGGYYETKEACELVKPLFIRENSDAQCVKRRGDPR
jgi:hypothetical protein